jgi:hypothetical protein
MNSDLEKMFINLRIIIETGDALFEGLCRTGTGLARNSPDAARGSVTREA